MTLEPLQNSTPTSEGPLAPAQPDTPINCTAKYTQYPHYSKKYNDISWHWTWSCVGGSASFSGTQSLYYNQSSSRAVTTTFSNEGTSGNENIRYEPCLNGDWQGGSSGTFSAPNHTSGSVNGASPLRDITGC